MTATYFLRNSTVDYDINSFELKKELARSINTCDVSIVKTDADNVSIGDEPSLIYFDGSTETVLFSGRISDKQEHIESPMLIESFGGVINHVTAEEIYDDKSPEFIAEDLITNYTDLTYASTASSGIVITRFVVNTDTLGDAFNNLLQLLTDWYIRSDNDKNFYFEPKNTTLSSETITINEDAFLISDWDRNPDKIVNQITLIGDVQTFATDQDGFTAAGGETTTTLSFKPKGNVLITKDGTELVGGVEDGTSSPDFTVDRDNSVITYAVSLNLNEVITIFYEYEVPIKVSAQNDGSITTFGSRGAPKVENKNIRTMDDARIWVQNYLATNSVEDIKGEFKVDINRDINAGELLPVVDTFNNINETFLVNSVTTSYPLGMKTIKVGRVKFDSLINDKEIKDRLKKLEQQFDNTDLLQLYREIVEKLNVSFVETVLPYTRDINDSWVWGVSKWGTGKWGDRRSGDKFSSYNGGTVIGDNWTVSGSVSVSNDTLEMDASVGAQTALYDGWEASTYEIVDGKIGLSFDRDAGTGTSQIRFRRADSSNYYYVLLDFVNDDISLYKNVAGSPTALVSDVSKTFSATNNLLTIRFEDTSISVEDGSDFLIETTDSSITATGQVELQNDGNTMNINYIKLYEGE